MRLRLLVLAVGLAATAASAEDTCLNGASTLPDQRALAALRAATDAACPCSAFTKRKDYQACAGGVRRAALDAGALRAACKREAKQIEAGAVCGSDKVACGRFKASAVSPVSCRLKPSSGCMDGRGVEAHACTDETHCADVVDWTAGTCVDVREPGPFAAGARVVTFTKPSVATYCAGGSGTCQAKPYGASCPCNVQTDCASGACTTVDRVLTTSVWYPAPPGSGPVDARFRAVLDAPLDPSGAPYPLLMFSHGSCGYPNQSLFLTSLLASHGFIVAAPPHPGNTIADYPTCGTAQAQVASFLERPQDVLYAMNGLLAAGHDATSPFFDALDEARIGMSGHSFGGLTTYLTVPLDPRFKVALPMAPAVPRMPVLGVPSLTMLGQIDSVVDDDAIRTAYADATAPKYLVEIGSAGHFAFSDLCFPSPDCAPPATLTQAEAHDDVRRWALPFLEVYLAGDPSFVPFLAAAPPPGIVVRSER